MSARGKPCRKQKLDQHGRLYLGDARECGAI